MQNLVLTEKKRRGRPSTKNLTHVPSIINFDKVDKLKNLDIDVKMLETMASGLVLDELISYEGGIPKATNIMCGGSPGIGKTTVLLDLLASVKNKDKSLKVLFISAEMGKKQMFKYTQRFPYFGNVDTLFTSDFNKFNSKDVIEQILAKGYDLVLIDSVAEIVEAVREDNNWDRKTTESWLVDICVSNNKGENDIKKYTSFIHIQQFTKGNEFAGSNRLKHLMDATVKMLVEDEIKHIIFTKNRNGQSGVKLDFNLMNDKIIYGVVSDADEDDM